MFTYAVHAIVAHNNNIILVGADMILIYNCTSWTLIRNRDSQLLYLSFIVKRFITLFARYFYQLETPLTAYIAYIGITSR